MRIIIKEPNTFSTYFKMITNYELELPITGITTDSREVKENDLFISIKGKRHNGNNFLKDVYESKASAALVSKLDKKVKIQQILVKNTIEIICAIAKLWRGKYSIPIIAITGSNGKTSTKELLYHVLSDQYKVHATKKNHNTILGVSLTLLELDDSFDISILELGSSQLGEIKNLCDISKPTHGLITNISQAHLTGLKSIEKIIHEKGALFNALKNGLSFVNTADKKVRGIEVKGKKVTFGTNSDCDFSAEIKTEKDGTLTLSIDSYIILMGSYNHSFLKNIIAVNAVAQTLGIKKNKLKSKIQSFKTPSGRCSIKKFKKATIIDDSYNANLDSCLAALNYLNAFLGGKRKIFVFGDMYELGDKSIEQHKLIGEKCTNLNFDGVFTIGNETINTNSAIDKSIMHEHFQSREEMIIFLRNFIESGDIVLFKGSRLMKMENIIDGVFTI